MRSSFHMTGPVKLRPHRPAYAGVFGHILVTPPLGLVKAIEMHHAIQGSGGALFGGNADLTQVAWITKGQTANGF